MNDSEIGVIETWLDTTGRGQETPLLSHGYPGSTALWDSPSQATMISFGAAAVAGVLRRSCDRIGHHASVWLPWAFQPHERLEAGVSSVGLGAIASGLTLSSGQMQDLDATPIIPSCAVYTLINPAQALVNVTPLGNESTAIYFLTPGLRPRVVRVRDSQRLMPSTTSPPREVRASEAVHAVRDLVDWLEVSRDEVAEICGFSLRASHYWTGGVTPRPTTTRRLYEVHSLIRSLVKAIGSAETRNWLRGADRSGTQRLELLGEADGPARLTRAAAEFLFELPYRERPRSEPLEDLDDRPTFEGAMPGLPLRRPRKPPSRA